MRVEGLDDLVAGLMAEGLLAEARAAEAVATTAQKVEDTAREIVAVRTGATRDSIQTTQSGASAEIGPTTPWATFVEFGTYKDAPQPFMGPAGDRHEDDLAEELERLVGEL
jgi:HK97 gp10 family phage protein